MPLIVLDDAREISLVVEKWKVAQFVYVENCVSPNFNFWFFTEPYSLCWKLCLQETRYDIARENASTGWKKEK